MLNKNKIIVPKEHKSLKILNLISAITLPSMFIGMMIIPVTTLNIMASYILFRLVYKSILYDLINIRIMLPNISIYLLFIIYMYCLVSVDNTMTINKTLIMLSVSYLIVLSFYSILYLLYYRKLASKCNEKIKEIKNDMDYLNMKYGEGVKYKK